MTSLWDPVRATEVLRTRCTACLVDLRLPQNAPEAVLSCVSALALPRLERLSVTVFHGAAPAVGSLLESESLAALRSLDLTISSPRSACHARVFSALPYAALLRLRVRFGDVAATSAPLALADNLGRAVRLRRLALENVASLERVVLPPTLVSLTVRGHDVPFDELAAALRGVRDLRQLVLHASRRRVSEATVARLLFLASVSVSVEGSCAVRCRDVVAILRAAPATVRACPTALVRCEEHGPRVSCRAIQSALDARRQACTDTLAEVLAEVLPAALLPELVAAYLQTETVPPTDSERTNETQKTSQSQSIQ